VLSADAPTAGSRLNDDSDLKGMEMPPEHYVIENDANHEDSPVSQDTKLLGA